MEPVTLTPLPPKEAIDYFRAKGMAESFAWQDVWQEEHARAFTVAKATSPAVLQDIRDAVDAAIANGTTLEQFRRELTPLLQARGWWGRQEMADPLTGEVKNVQLGSPRRLRTIFDVNLRSAYAAGRWERIQASKSALPWLRYTCVLDARTRPEHRAWHGVIKGVDDPWWNTHYPPCGWRCRCTVVQLSERAMRRRGWTASPDAPAFPKRLYVNPRSGQASYIEQGIDPGFNFNIGRAHLDPLTPRPQPVQPVLPGIPIPAPLPELPEPAWVGRPLIRPEASPQDMQESFLGMFGATAGRQRTFVDAGGEPFVVGEALFQDEAGRTIAPAKAAGLMLAGRAIRYPDEIRWIWRESAGGRQLQRRYISRFQVTDGIGGRIEAAAVVDAVSGGGAPSWSFSTSLEPDFGDLARWRTGRLAWRRISAAELDLSSADLSAISFYTGDGYGPMNAYLRDDQWADEDVLASIDQLDSILRRARLPRPAVLHRTLSGWPAYTIMERGIGPGDVLRDLGFMSTSRDPNAAARFDLDEGIQLVIHARAGDRALDVSAFSNVGNEHEILFSRGQALKVLHWDDERRILTVETSDD